MYPYKRPAKVRTSPLWKLFKRMSPGLARCHLCKKDLSFKSSITNLKRHLLLKHGGDVDDILQTFGPNTGASKQQSTEQLISLVKNYACLWDTSCSSYGNDENQQVAWNIIASIMHPMDDQNVVASNLAAHFNELKNELFLNPQCRYSEELSFMKPSLDTDDEPIVVNAELCNVEIKLEAPDEFRTNKDDLAIREDNNHSEQDFDEENVNEEQLSSPNKEVNFGTNLQHPSGDDYKVQIPVMASSECNLQLNNVDDNALFLLSMVGDMRKVPNELQMDLRTELMTTFSKIIKKYENMN